MNWEDLRCTDRDRAPREHAPGDQRNEFERDYDRIINSSAFRRLQDKAQVFPLDRTDFVHTRLTHSLEVERLGAAMARDLYRQDSSLFPGSTEAEIETLVGSACLAHDIGNPPFGHAGEKTIQLWFRDYFERNPEVADKLSSAECDDFLKFEGNAQTLRIVTRLQVQWEKDEPGLHLTYATLAVLMKYVAASSEAGPGKGQSRSKPGYFQSEKDIVAQVRARTGVEGRHPLTFLVEAADDMAYAAVDIEDALKKRVVDLPLVAHTIIANIPDAGADLKKLVEQYLVVDSGWKIADRVADQLMRYQRFRIKVLGYMLRRVIEAYLARHEEIMDGTFDDELVRVSAAADIWEALRAVAKEHVYTSHPVSLMETTGDAVIRGLLDRFVPSVLGARREDSKHPDAKLYRLISPVWRSMFEDLARQDQEHATYHALQLVTDFVCGMTDNYALSLFRQISGVEPLYT